MARERAKLTLVGADVGDVVGGLVISFTVGRDDELGWEEGRVVIEGWDDFVGLVVGSDSQGFVSPPAVSEPFALLLPRGTFGGACGVLSPLFQTRFC